MNNTLSRRSACGLVTAAILSFSASAAHAAADSVKLGFITDLSGLYSDSDGQGGLEAIRMAIDDFGGKVNGKPGIRVQSHIALRVVEMSPSERQRCAW